MTICLICRQAQLAPNFATVKLDHEEIKLTIRRVPAGVCPNCSEAYVEDKIAARLFQMAEQSIKVGLTRGSLVYSISD